MVRRMLVGFVFRCLMVFSWVFIFLCSGLNGGRDILLNIIFFKVLLLVIFLVEDICFLLMYLMVKGFY